MYICVYAHDGEVYLKLLIYIVITNISFCTHDGQVEAPDDKKVILMTIASCIRAYQG